MFINILALTGESMVRKFELLFLLKCIKTDHCTLCRTIFTS